MAGWDPLAELRAAGFAVEVLSDEQREVLSTLTEEELVVLTDVRQRLTDSAPEVEAHSGPMTIGGLLF